MAKMLALLLLLSAGALQHPEPVPFNPRFRTVAYQPDQVIAVESAIGYQMAIEFAADEQIETVAIGDGGAWQAVASRSGDRLFIKPIQSGSSTNMTVVTNVRTYAFDLTPLETPTTDMAYTVRFTYPEPPPDAASAQAIEIVGRYRIGGDITIRPINVMDDGTHTYVSWSPDQAIPAIYSVDARGQEAVVNGMMRGDMFVIDSVSPRLVFRIDRRTARAVRSATQGRP